MAELPRVLRNTLAVTAGACVLAFPVAKERNFQCAPAKIWTLKALKADRGYKTEQMYCRLHEGCAKRPCIVCNETGSLASGGTEGCKYTMF